MPAEEAATVAAVAALAATATSDSSSAIATAAAVAAAAGLAPSSSSPPSLNVPAPNPSPRQTTMEGHIIPHDHDVLSGRGASVNSHAGNTRFRALCFHKKSDFDGANHAAKRRIATEIVQVVTSLEPPGRFLKVRVVI
uniref:DUF6824 domain-containing protein n=1 Tax=Ditylum brightwellii TaxID=49249 RepID=A0A7S4VJM1_9STRA